MHSPPNSHAGHTGPRASAAQRPLLVTNDPDLLDDVLRLAVAAGVELQVAADAPAARSAWAHAPVVLVGADVGEAIARAALRRRDGVVMVTCDLDDAGVWRRAVNVGAEHVAVLPDAEAWLVRRLGEAAESVAGNAGRALTIGVIGGRGGAGASTLAAALALTGMRYPSLGRRCLLLDADPFGGGADLLFGGEHVEGVRWPDLAGVSGRIAGAALREALPRVGELAVLSWDRGDPLEVRAEAMGSVLGAAGRGCDLVVLDLPRRFDDVTDVALAQCDFALLVVPAEVRACAAAARVAAHVSRHCGDVRAVVRGPSPAGLTADDVAAALALPLAGWLHPEPNLDAALECGEAPASSGQGPLAEFCARLLAAELPEYATTTDLRAPVSCDATLGWTPG